MPRTFSVHAALAAVAVVGLATGARATEVTVDVFAPRKPISPGIYGLNFGSDQQLSRLGITVRRFGGNQFSRYNYQTSTTNEGGDDHFFRNLVLDGGSTDYADHFISVTKQANADVVLELPLLKYVSKAGSAVAAPWTCGFDVGKYGPQQQVLANCGDGLHADGGWVMGNSPLDTSVSIDSSFWTGWLDHLTSTFGKATAGGVRYYDLGNQPALWNRTHHDVHPQALATYDEISAQFTASTTAVKTTDPAALTLGPSEWGWLNYFDSAAQEAQSRGVDFVPFYLRQAHTLATARGYRTLDFLNLHVYPQAMTPNATAIISDDVSVDTAALRLRSTRILWDPTYQLESWEQCCKDSVMRLIPRMHDWVAAEYPGTGVSLSGYSWGAFNHLSGALAQTEVLGIFGREGVDLAMLEGDIPDGALVEDAFRIFRNFDGAGSRFGDQSAVTTSSDPTMMGAYGAYDSSGRITVVVINKDPTTVAAVNVNLNQVAGGKWRSYGFGPAGRLASIGSGGLNGSVLAVAVPAYSAELIEVVPSGYLDGGMPGPLDGGTGGGGGDPSTCSCQTSPGPLALLVAIAAASLYVRSRRRPR